MTPYKHLIYLAQSHWTFWCVGSSEYSPSLLSWVQFFFSFSFIFFNMNCSSGTSAQEDGLLFHRKDKGCVHLWFVMGFSDYWEGRDISDPWILRFFFFFFLPHKTSVACGREVMLYKPGSKTDWKKESEGRGEERQITFFPHLHYLARDWKKKTKTKQSCPWEKIIFRKRSYIFKKVLKCIRFPTV